MSPIAASGTGEATQPSSASRSYQVIDVTVDGLWQALAREYGTTVDQLRADNPSVDFSQAPAPGTQLSFQQVADGGPTTTVFVLGPPVVEETFTTTSVLAPVSDTTYVIDVSTSTLAAPPEVLETSACQQFSSAELQSLGDDARALSGSDPASTTISAPIDALGWCDVPELADDEVLYQIQTGDYLHRIAGQFCTSAEDLVARNAWADGMAAALHSGQLIAVPGAAC